VEHSGDNTTRLDRVESDVATIRGEMGGLKNEVTEVRSDVRALGGILSRIEQSVTESQRQASSRELASRPNLVAVVSVLITLIVTLIGGSFMIGGQLARADERYRANIREFDQLHQKVDRVPVGAGGRDVTAPPS
jgi:outer membrane murein-binding lipoprotein Lpp